MRARVRVRLIVVSELFATVCTATGPCIPTNEDVTEDKDDNDDDCELTALTGDLFKYLQYR